MKTHPIELRELVRRYGTNSNAFFALYPGFSSYPARSGEAGVAYLRTRHAHLGVTEPFAPEANRFEILEEFFRYSREQGADALAMPVGQELARLAGSHQHEVIPIGTEVLFNLDEINKQGNDWMASVPAARQLSEKGGFVREVSQSEFTDDLRLTLGEIYQDWNTSKRIPPLGFLNRIEPWTLAEDKKLFVIEVAGRIVAFLSGLPIWSRSGWYLVDLIRTPKSPVGSTELLMLESMRLLHEQGSKWVSLGVAPLANLKDVEFGSHPMLYRVLHRFFEFDSDLYACKSLYQFKLKFHPTHLEPAYLVAARGTTLPRILRALGEAYLPLGLIGTFLGSALRVVRRAFGMRIFDRITDPDMVLRPLPSGATEFLRRSLFSWVLMLSWIAVYAQSLRIGGHVDAGFLSSFGYSWHEFNSSEWTWSLMKRLLFSGFIHEDLVHLWLNMALMVLVGPTFEMLWGRAVFATVFFLPMLFGNLLASALFQIFFTHMPAISAQVQAALSYLDVGSSLGIFGCYGGLLFSLRNKSIWALVVIFALMSYAGFSGHWVHMNHLVAMALGFAIMNALQWKKRFGFRYAY